MMRINRRLFLAGASATLGASCALATPVGSNEAAPQTQVSTTPAMKSFPFELITVAGSDLLATFNRLRTTAGKSPVVLGDDDGLDLTFENMSFPGASGHTEDILAKAETLAHPEGLLHLVAADTSQANASLRDILMKRPDNQLPQMERGGRQLSPAETRARLLADLAAPFPEPELGVWPDQAPVNDLFGMIIDYKTNQLPDRVHIALIPTDDWTEIPAYLRWGGWNACPPPEYHVAAFRSWRDRYGARLVTLSGDSAELQVDRKPGSRNEALALARELYAYNNDLIDQGYEALAPLAANLMASDVWGFWWD